jgi:hypothetical protein
LTGKHESRKYMKKAGEFLDRTPAEGSNKICKIGGRQILDRRDMKDLREGRGRRVLDGINLFCVNSPPLAVLQLVSVTVPSDGPPLGTTAATLNTPLLAAGFFIFSSGGWGKVSGELPIRRKSGYIPHGQSQANHRA